MLIATNIDEYEIDNIYLCESIKNTIIHNGRFTRILYTLPNFTINGIHIAIDLEKCNTDYINNKCKCNFDIKKNVNVINKIIQLEQNLLTTINVKNKNKIYNLTQQLNTGSIRLFIEKGQHKSNSNSYILKIAGIWEDNDNYGITYKFIQTNHL